MCLSESLPRKSTPSRERTKLRGKRHRNPFAQLNESVPDYMTEKQGALNSRVADDRNAGKRNCAQFLLQRFVCGKSFQVAGLWLRRHIFRDR